ncbi:transcriptional regulator [Halorientalis sp. IM1011]|uniref:helix-turn-helix domain-containing protein n=1 Tax=Halorientalis sp. IM1011 TaxID=1932360 RepID=UPI00097CD2FE|nr:multiprotein-bridging factor 1 family protein [Halorientalis sp. IM1011]AQL41503.1 transcriptional regulator [Halorientalis sp. IM1011]
MAKYSTGGAGGNAGGNCELCGAEDADLRTANVAGARLEVCADCAQHGDDTSDSSDDDSRSDSDRKRRAAQNTARIDDARTGDSTHWEEGGTDYEDDQLPYLVTDYGKRLTSARQDAGLQLEELAEELDIDESDLLAVEQGRATQAGVGGSVISKLEDRLDVDLAES